VRANQILLAGYEVWILDKSHIGGTEHRLRVIRAESAATLPAQACAVVNIYCEISSLVIWHTNNYFQYNQIHYF
jgi:hypothetical protein